MRKLILVSTILCGFIFSPGCEEPDPCPSHTGSITFIDEINYFYVTLGYQLDIEWSDGTTTSNRYYDDVTFNNKPGGITRYTFTLEKGSSQPDLSLVGSVTLISCDHIEVPLIYDP